MAEHTYQTIGGRKLDLSELGDAERTLLAEARAEFARSPEWSAFTAWWIDRWQRSGLPFSSPVYRICQDLEARLGIRQGMVAEPDYRDVLVDLIEERFGSRYRFCKETGFDPGHLSRIVAGQSGISIKRLQEVLQTLGASLVIRRDEEAAGGVEDVPTGDLAAVAATGGSATGRHER